jgi:hypothetical protein
LLPWGWTAQTIAGLGTSAARVAAPHLVTTTLSRFRRWCCSPRELGVRRVLSRSLPLRGVSSHRAADRRSEIAAALSRVGATLSQHLGQPDVLDGSIVSQPRRWCVIGARSSSSTSGDALLARRERGLRPEIGPAPSIDYPLDSMPLIAALLTSCS